MCVSVRTVASLLAGSTPGQELHGAKMDCVPDLPLVFPDTKVEVFEAVVLPHDIDGHDQEVLY